MKKIKSVISFLFFSCMLSFSCSSDSDELSEEPTTPANPVQGDYQLVWSEEFDGNSLDESKWNYEIGGGGWGNSEKQYYTKRPKNISVANGFLIIKALKESYENYSYTSARVTTKGKYEFTYGKIEARISLPSGAGTWPAFWMHGTDSGWPLCGEIDIMEHIGSNPNMTSHATHTFEKNGLKGTNWFNRQHSESSMEGDFHIYTLEWEEKADNGDDLIRFCIDNKQSTVIYEPHNINDERRWPFNRDFFIILNMALGGSMGGKINDDIFNNPIEMKVDYVRVYQKK